jgi:hypothetical protein
MALTSGGCARAPVIRGAVASGNQGEICDRFRMRIAVADSATYEARDQKLLIALLNSKIGRGLFASIALNLVLDGLSLVE